METTQYNFGILGISCFILCFCFCVRLLLAIHQWVDQFQTLTQIVGLISLAVAKNKNKTLKKKEATISKK